MTKDIYVRNPQTGLLETKEFAAMAQLATLRISDPVATNLVQGFTNAELKGDQIFTPVKMAKEAGRFPAWGKEAFVIPGNLKRGIGEPVQRVNVLNSYVTMSLDEYALGASIENRERNEWAGSPDSLVNGKLSVVAGKIALYREYLQAVLATTYTNYASTHRFSGAAKAWATTGKAVKDMKDLIDLVLSYNGVRPDTVWFSPAAWSLWENNQSVIDCIKYGNSPANPTIVTEEATARLLKVKKVVVPNAVYGTGVGTGKPKGSALTQGFLWDSVATSAGCCISGTGSGMEPAFGYTWERDNSPIVESYYDNATKSQIWDYEHFFTPAITLNTAGAIYYSLA